MNKKKIESILISEEDYALQMKSIVEPFLADCGEEFFMEREPSHAIHGFCYVPEYPRALIIISHGFTESAEKYKEMVYYFLKGGYIVYIIDHCGHSLSYRLVEGTAKIHVDNWERYRDDLLFVAHAARQRYPELPYYLFGHSMGGAIAAAATAADPQLFDRVILNAPMIRMKTGGVPWPVTKGLCAFYMHMGKEKEFALSQSAFDPKTDTFEKSASTSRARYEYYKAKRIADPMLQTNGATFGWLSACTKMCDYLMDEGYKTIEAPLLLFQAESDGFVCNSIENAFIRKLSASSYAKLTRVPGSRHEIFNSTNDVMEKYLAKIFRFYSGNI